MDVRDGVVRPEALLVAPSGVATSTGDVSSDDPAFASAWRQWNIPASQLFADLSAVEDELPSEAGAPGVELRDDDDVVPLPPSIMTAPLPEFSDSLISTDDSEKDAVAKGAPSTGDSILVTLISQSFIDSSLPRIDPQTPVVPPTIPKGLITALPSIAPAVVTDKTSGVVHPRPLPVRFQAALSSSPTEDASRSVDQIDSDPLRPVSAGEVALDAVAGFQSEASTETVTASVHSPTEPFQRFTTNSPKATVEQPGQHPPTREIAPSPLTPLPPVATGRDALVAALPGHPPLADATPSETSTTIENSASPTVPHAPVTAVKRNASILGREEFDSDSATIRRGVSDVEPQIAASTLAGDDTTRVTRKQGDRHIETPAADFPIENKDALNSAGLTSAWTASISQRATEVPADQDLFPQVRDAGPPAAHEQIRHALSSAGGLDQQFHISLTPPELGPVHIVVVREDGRVQARLTTESAQAHRLLTEQLPQLLETFVQLGWSVDQVQILRSETPVDSATFSQQFREENLGQHDGQSRQQPQQEQPTAAAQWMEEAESAPGPIPSSWRRTGLNLRV